MLLEQHRAWNHDHFPRELVAVLDHPPNEEHLSSIWSEYTVIAVKYIHIGCHLQSDWNKWCGTWRLLLARTRYWSTGCTDILLMPLAVNCFLTGAGNTGVGSQISEWFKSNFLRNSIFSCDHVRTAKSGECSQLPLGCWGGRTLPCSISPSGAA